MSEIIQFLHPWLAFIALAVVLATYGYRMGVENECERLVKKARENGVYVYDKELGQWRFLTVKEILDE